MGYLKPLRRKIGVLTLLMACVLAAAWVRSLTVLDEVGLIRRDSYQRVALMCGAIVYARERPTPKSGIHDGWLSGTLENRFRKYPTVDGWQSCYPLDLEMSRIEACGFAYGKASPSGYTLNVLVVPYWSVVIPLTLLSTYLLLSKRN